MTPDQMCPACGCNSLTVYKSKAITPSLIRRYRRCKTKGCLYRERLLLRPATILQRKELG